jgi:hypothetical protein
MDKDLEKQLKEGRDGLEEKIRDYCRSQKELWRRVPYLALQANSIGRYYHAQYALAYESGLWRVGKADYPSGQIFVDLESGELVRYNLLCRIDKGPFLEPATIEEIFSLGTIAEGDSLIRKLDTENIIRELVDRADHSIHDESPGNDDEPFYSTEEYLARQAAWRKAKIEELGLTELYVRKWPPLIYLRDN